MNNCYPKKIEKMLIESSESLSQAISILPNISSISARFVF